jgi:hypothetical protein
MVSVYVEMKKQKSLTAKKEKSLTPDTHRDEVKLEEVEAEAESMILLEEAATVKTGGGNEEDAEAEVEVMIEQDERVMETVDHAKKIVLTSVKEEIHAMIEGEQEPQGVIGGKNSTLQIARKGIGILIDIGKMIGEKVEAHGVIKWIDSNIQIVTKGKEILVDTRAMRK